MFPARLFPNRYFAARYWPNVGADAVPAPALEQPLTLAWTDPNRRNEWTDPNRRLEWGT